jgi:hypothetical protein
MVVLVFTVVLVFDDSFGIGFGILWWFWYLTVVLVFDGGFGI